MFLESCIAEEIAKKQTGGSDVLKKLAQEQIEKQKSQQMLIDNLVRSVLEEMNSCILLNLKL